MDVHTGQILAMASLPAYDDNDFGPPVNAAAINQEDSAPGDPFLEHATQTAMPPGSTFKLVVGAADVTTDAIPPSTVIPTGGTFDYDGTTYVNWETLPPQNLAQAVAWSNDVYFYKLALALGPARIATAAGDLGVGQPTGIDLPDEASGFFGTPSSIAADGLTWYPGSTVDMGIGQGYITATPLQDARWTAAVATGQLVTPQLGLAAGPSGQANFIDLPEPAPKALSFAPALGPVQQGLRNSVESGTGTLLASLPIPAAGKTGTAQDPSAPDGGPDAWYTAYSPAANPNIVVTVNVRGGGEGYYTAEPVVRDLLKYYDANTAQIMSTAPLAPPPVLPAITQSPAPLAPAGAFLMLPLPLVSARQKRRRRLAFPATRLRLQRRRLGAGVPGSPRSQRPPPGDVRNL
jgi:cell division protein FtsI/penicillin-binding protein 2